MEFSKNTNTRGMKFSGKNLKYSSEIYQDFWQQNIAKIFFTFLKKEKTFSDSNDKSSIFKENKEPKRNKSDKTAGKKIQNSNFKSFRIYVLYIL